MQTSQRLNNLLAEQSAILTAVRMRYRHVNGHMQAMRRECELWERELARFALLNELVEVALLQGAAEPATDMCSGRDKPAED